ncbi:MAG: putative DNA binding domain-containing protein [Bacteroidales bacterium]|nr:putative DNA binding domain-containing protein [Bacteroidales bacterium]
MKTIEEQYILLEDLLAQARQRQSAGETEWMEFKTNIGESRCSVTYEGVGNYISGLSNSACLKYKSHGYLVLGVEDGTWNVVGTNLRMPTAKYGNQDYELWLRKNCSPITPFEIEEFEYEDKHIVIFEIQAAAGEPVNFKGAAYVRVGSNLTKLKDFPDYVRQIYNSQKDWSAEIVKDATFDDLDPDAIKEARKMYAKKHEDLIVEMKSWDDVRFLNKAKITKQGQITNTAILLLGRTESEHFISPAVARIRWIYKDSNGEEKDFSIETCPFVIAANTVYRKIRNWKYRYMNPELLSLVPDELDTYDPFIIREALNNAIAHQDYGRYGMINVIEEEDRLIFTNLGTFIPNSIKNVLINDAPEEHYRNRFLATAMVELGMVDTIGSGIRRMFNKQRERLFPMPDYEFSDDRVKVTIIGKVVDIDYAMLLTRDKTLTLLDIEMLSRLQTNRPLSDEEIAYLRKRKLIEGRKNALFFAKSVAKATGQKAEYTRNKGFDDNYYKDLILKALDQHVTMSRPEIDTLLMTKLPEALTDKQKVSKIGNLLTSLRKADKIVFGEKKLWRRK